MPLFVRSIKSRSVSAQVISDEFKMPHTVRPAGSEAQ